MGPYTWNVRHRYSEFYELHEQLVLECSLERSLLPGKKLFGRTTDAFIRKRQSELEIYLQRVLQQLLKVPSCLANFLAFHQYVS